MQHEAGFQEPPEVFGLPFPSFGYLRSSYCKSVSPEDHIMVAGYPEATELFTPVFVVCLQSVCFFASLNGTDHESQAVKWNYCVGVQSLQATENKNVILYSIAVCNDSLKWVFKKSQKRYALMLGIQVQKNVSFPSFQAEWKNYYFSQTAWQLPAHSQVPSCLSRWFWEVSRA